MNLIRFATKASLKHIKKELPIKVALFKNIKIKERLCFLQFSTCLLILYSLLEYISPKP